jgi:uncharacterized protein
MFAAKPAPLDGATQHSARLGGNVVHFARLLRHAGLTLGTDRTALALQALQVAGLASRAELHAVLAACLLDRHEHRELFDQAFDLFWRAPGGPTLQPDSNSTTGDPSPISQRLAQALQQSQGAGLAPRDSEAPTGAAWHDAQSLRKADFDSMSAEEWQQAQQLLLQMPLWFEPLPTRRSQRAPKAGRADWRATLAAMGRQGGEWAALRWRQPRTRPAPLLLLADISGSMSRYTRMLLHFAHTLGRARAQAMRPVESFVFGTRLTRTTRLLKNRDPDVAIGQVVQAVQDWQGGTRIGSSLHEFNQRWARRVLSSQSTVLLVSDGLEHGNTQQLAQLAFEMQRLHKSCRRLVWLNPLLRFTQFEPRAAGIRAMLPHTDHFVPAHNLDSLADLALLLSTPAAHAHKKARR